MALGARQLERISRFVMNSGSPVLQKANAMVRTNTDKPPAAVLVPLFNCAPNAGSTMATAHALFTLRTTALSAHGGEVCFPGGHIDSGEVSQ